MSRRTVLVKLPTPPHTYRGDSVLDEDGRDRCAQCGLPRHNRVHDDTRGTA